MTRIRDFRKSFNHTSVEPVASNYYPTNLFIYTQDVATGAVLSVVTDRSQGGSSLSDGSLELMVQRRLQRDDNRGVGEPLNETGLNSNGTGLIVRGVHRVSINAAATAGQALRESVAHSMHGPWWNAAPLTTATVPAWVSK